MQILVLIIKGIIKTIWAHDWKLLLPYLLQKWVISPNRADLGMIFHQNFVLLGMGKDIFWRQIAKHPYENCGDFQFKLRSKFLPNSIPASSFVIIPFD